MNEIPNAVKETLSSLIAEMSASPELFVKNPGTDFTRNRKLPFEAVVQLLISMGGNSVYKELLEAQGYDTSETFYQNAPDEKGYNLLHLNAMYDLCNRLYVDALIQPRRLENESKALVDMVRRSHIRDKVIIIADRAFESYNNFANIEKKGWNYLIRVKDLVSSGILSALTLPTDGEFDIWFSRVLTRKQTNEVKAHPEIYRYISHSSPFDFLDDTNKFYPMTFRVARFKITEDTYETVITNLDASEFSPEELKELYHMRWGIETSFRELKYAVGLTNFHSKKREYIVQVIFARIIMYNFAEMITSHVVISQTDTKHSYQVNFTVAIHICNNSCGYVFGTTRLLPMLKL